MQFYNLQYIFLSLSYSKIINNTASTFSGAVYVEANDGTMIDISHCQFLHNKVRDGDSYRHTGDGGALYLTVTSANNDTSIITPTYEPTKPPTLSDATMDPTNEPTNEPTTQPTIEPTIEPTTSPTAEPTIVASTRRRLLQSITTTAVGYTEQLQKTFTFPSDVSEAVFTQNVQMTSTTTMNSQFRIQFNFTNGLCTSHWNSFEDSNKISFISRLIIYNVSHGVVMKCQQENAAQCGVYETCS